MKISNILKKFGENPLDFPNKIFMHLAYNGKLNWMSDSLFVKTSYLLNMKKKLNLKNPRTFNEKLSYLKLYNRCEEYSRLVDKFEAKEWASDIIGKDYIIPTIGVWDSFDSIEFDKLPNRFVLKCTHDSGGVVVCTDKSIFDYESAKKKLELCLSKNYYSISREYPYQNIKPRIIAEGFLDIDSDDCAEYKMFCYNGKFNWVLVCTGIGHTEGRTNDGFTKDFVHLPVRFTCKNSEVPLSKPDKFDELIRLAETLAVGTIQVRVDFYLLRDKIYFGEMTFFHDGGMCHFVPANYDEVLGVDLNVK